MSEPKNTTSPEGGDDVGGGDSVDPNSVEGLFFLAVQKPASEREAYLDEVCGQDRRRRLRVTALLRAYDDAGSFLETPAIGSRPGDVVSLDFLKPSDKPDCLGIIGPYEVLEVVGRGGMGVVLRAVDPKLSRIVAVKVLLPELARNANSRRRFLREAQAAAAVSHPHIVTIHAVQEATIEEGEIETPPYLVMECVVGQSLQEKLDIGGTLRLAEILRISRQVAEGLSAAHQQGLIHRDIKPANILLENGVQRVKITDFGLARAIDDVTITRTGEVSGTPQYMSPEQAEGRPVDHRSDLFSLGCVMYAMCTGHSPFRADTLAHTIKRVTQDTPRSITEQNPEIPGWLEEITDCLLEKDATNRFQNAESLLAILDQHLARLQQSSDSGSHALINVRLPKASAGSDTTSDNPAGKQPAESIHGHVGRRLLQSGLFLLVLPFPLIGMGMALRDGDVMEFGGQLLIPGFLFALPVIVAGYILRYIIDTQPGRHRPLRLFAPATLAVVIALVGGMLHVISEQRAGLRETAVPNPIITPVPVNPVIVLKHPEWTIRKLSVNGLGSTRSAVSKTETHLSLDPKLLGTHVSIYVILQDGREFSRYGIPLERLKSEIIISEQDLQLQHRALVEVVEDAPGVSLRMVKYPTQRITKNEFSIGEAPFHKALQPGEHRIVLDFVRDDWDVPDGVVQYSTLDYRVTVPDPSPIKLSLKKILEEHGDEAKIHRVAPPNAIHFGPVRGVICISRHALASGLQLHSPSGRVGL